MKSSGIVLLLAGLGLTFIGCTHGVKYAVGDPTAAADSKAVTHYEVAMLEFRFRPESLNVLTGDTVTWLDHGGLPHTTTSGVNGRPDGRWDSGQLSRGGSFSYVFTEPGVFHYYCTPHHVLGMKGVVVVTAR